MRAILVIEEDPLIRELMREHLERDGYVACAVGTVRGALEAAQQTRFGLVMLDVASAALCAPEPLAALRAFGAPVVTMRSAPAGQVAATPGEIDAVAWSPFDLATLTAVVRRFVPAANSAPGSVRAAGPVVTASGTYRATRASDAPTALGLASTLPAPADDDEPVEASAEPVSLEMLGELVLRAIGSKR